MVCLRVGTLAEARFQIFQWRAQRARRAVVNVWTRSVLRGLQNWCFPFQARPRLLKPDTPWAELARLLRKSLDRLMQLYLPCSARPNTHPTLLCCWAQASRPKTFALALLRNHHCEGLKALGAKLECGCLRFRAACGFRPLATRRASSEISGVGLKTRNILGRVPGSWEAIYLRRWNTTRLRFRTRMD